jgi:type II secretory pathway pseudopilin PulG
MSSNHFRIHACRLRAFTKVELLAVLMVFGLLVLMTLPAMAKARDRRNRIACVNSLKNIGLAFRIFSRTSAPEFPWTVDSSDGGSKEHVTDPAALWLHFAAISNELSQPKHFICPSDRERRSATSWSEFTNNHFVSYALGFSATEETPQSILAADRNIRLDGAVLTNVILSFPSNVVVTFDQRLHNGAGNLMLGDGSVQQVSSRNLSEFFLNAHQANGTNVLAFP